MALLSFLAGLIICGFSWRRIASYVLGPAARREVESEAQTQFMLGDLVWLIVLLQVSLAVVVAQIPRQRMDLFGAFFVFAFGATLALWWGTMRMVSRAGVRSQWRRGLFVLVVVPLTLAILVTAGLAFIGLPIAALGRQSSEPSLSFLAKMCLGAWLILPIALLLIWPLRRATLWALNDSVAVQPDDLTDAAAEDCQDR